MAFKTPQSGEAPMLRVLHMPITRHRAGHSRTTRSWEGGDGVGGG